MSLELDYHLSSQYGPPFADPTGVSEGDLRYRLFTGDIIFRLGECDFGTSWGWVPILDFAVGLRWVVAELSRLASSAYDFTESESALRFDRDADTVTVTASYSECVGECEYGELETKSWDFARQAFGEFAQSFPGIAASEAFKKLSEQLR